MLSDMCVVFFSYQRTELGTLSKILEKCSATVAHARFSYKKASGTININSDT